MRTPLPLTGVLLAIAVLLTGCAAADPPAPPGLKGIGDLPKPASAWPAAQYDARHSSGTPAVGPQHGTIAWTARIDGDLTPGPVIGTDGSVLQASHNGTLTAVDPATGKPRWTYDAGGGYGSDLSTSPAVLASGVILWPGPDSTLFALSAAGKPLWQERFSGEVLSPAVAGRNRVYVADLTGRLEALVVTGTAHRVAWTLKLNSVDYGSPAVGPDGTITTATANALVAIHDTGSRGAIAWRFPVKRMIEVSNGVSKDGVTVLGTNHDLEYGVDRDGKQLWGIPLGANTYSSSAVRPDGTAYFADNAGRIRVVDAKTGKVRLLQHPAVEHAWTSVVADARGDFYWGTTTGHVYGYDRTGRQLFDRMIGGGTNSYPAIGADGTLYFGTTDGRLVAIRG